MSSLKTFFSNPIKPALLLLEVLYFASNLYSAPHNHTFLLSVTFALSFSFWLILAVGQASSFLSQILLISLKIMILLNQVHYLKHIDWMEYHVSQQESLVLNLLLKDLLGLFILNLMSRVKSIIKFVHSLSVIHVFSVLMMTSVTETHKDFILAQIILKSLMFSLSFYVCCKLQRQEEGHKNPNKTAKKNEASKANINMLTNLLDNLTEKIIVFDHLGHIKYFNPSLKNSLKAENCPTIENLKHIFFGFKLNFSHFPSFSQLNKHDLLHTLSFNPLLHATKSLERAQKVTNLPDLFDLYMKNPEISVMGLASSPTFQAQFYCKETNSVKDIQLRAQVVQFSSQNEKQLLIFVREKIQEKLGSEAILFEKKKSVYQENFVSSISHELRTPLNSNLAFLEQAMDSSLVPLYVKEKLIKPALISAKLLYHIVNDLLDYSLISANTLKLEVRPKDLLKTVNRCMDLFYTKAGEKDLKLNLIIQGEIPHQFSIDHRRVSQILINLLNNAIQFTLTGEIEVILTRNSETSIMIAVKDTGIGISKESCERLKASLDTGDLREKIHEHSIGIGLSLFISNKLAKLLNPKSDSSQSQQQGIKFISQINHGSTFYFEVKNNKSSPLSPRKPSTNVEVNEQEFDLKNDILNYSTRMLKNRFDSSAQRSPQNIQGRVLIVDDEVFNIIVIENFCKSLGIPVEKALNGGEAIAKLKACQNDGQPPIKIVFMDINMPVKDGYQATMEIQRMIQKGEMKNVNIVGVTAYASKEKIEKGYSCGMDEVLNKPLSKEMIVEVLGFYKLKQ